MIVKRLALMLAALALLPAGSALADSGLKVRFDPKALGRPLHIDPNILKRASGLPSDVAGRGCTFYEHNNGGGKSWRKSVNWLAYDNQSVTTYAEYVTTVGPWWNDKISSMRCDDSSKVHCSAEVWRDDNRGGGDAIFWGTQGLLNLDRYGWNDTVSSYMVFCDRVK